jgi:DNA-binding transcriptional ArsR family regulator
MALRLPQPTVSHHLAALRLLRLVTNRRAGKRIYYRLGPSASVPAPKAFRIECPHFALSFELRDGELG